MSAPVIDSHRNVFFLSEGVAACENSAGGVDVEPKTRIVGPVVAGLLIVGMAGVAAPVAADGLCLSLPDGTAICVEPELILTKVHKWISPGPPENPIAWVGLVNLCIDDLDGQCSASDPGDTVVTVASVGEQNPPCDPWDAVLSGLGGSHCSDNDIGGDDEQALSADTDGEDLLCLWQGKYTVDVNGDGTPEYSSFGLILESPPC